MKRLWSFVALTVVAGALLFASFAFGHSTAAGLRFLIDLQESTATVTARWFYTPNPSYETWYDWVVVDEAAGDTIMADSTSLQETTFELNRAATDKAYRFGVRVWVKDALGSVNNSGYVDDRLIVPARPAATLLAQRNNVTAPILIPNDPAFSQPRGTVWLEFETTDDIQARQGLFSRDASGYGGGGHLSIQVYQGSIVARIQSDTASYEVQWPVVANSLNQAAVEFGDDTGFRLFVNGALAMSNPYTGGTVGNDLDLAIGALRWDWKPTSPADEMTNPFKGTVKVAEYYAGRYDFSGRWGLPPLPVPPPVDSLAIEVARIDHGQVEPLMSWNGQPTELDYFSIHFTPIQEAHWQVVMVNGDTLSAQDGSIWRPALLPVAGGDWKVFQSDSDGWDMYNARTGALCSALKTGWSPNGTSPCFTRAQLIAMQKRNADCVGGRYWAKHSTEIECNFNILIEQHANWQFPRGTNPVLRLEVFDAQKQRIGYWERRVS